MASESGARQTLREISRYRLAMAVTRRRPRIRWVVVPVCLLIAAVIGGLPVYVRPQVDPLQHADAILVLGGEGFSRYPFGIDCQVDYGVGNDAADVDESVRARPDGRHVSTGRAGRGTRGDDGHDDHEQKNRRIPARTCSARAARNRQCQTRRAPNRSGRSPRAQNILLA